MADEQHLRSLETKLDIVRDRVRGVACGYKTGFYLWGDGGTSKTFTVEQSLKQLGKAYKLTNSRLTAKGLFDLLDESPHALHVLDDVETLFSEQKAIGVLRSALWGTAGEDGKLDRRVTWQTDKGRQEVTFTGGIIMVANCSLDKAPQLQALKTRVPCLRFQASNEEIAALMRTIARQGYRFGQQSLSPTECLEVAEAIISRTRLTRNLDLRLLVNTFQDRLQWANGESTTDWRVLLECSMEERVLPLRGDSRSRSQRKEDEQAIANRIADLPRRDRLTAWQQATGKSEKALYRRRKEVWAPQP